MSLHYISPKNPKRTNHRHVSLNATDYSLKSYYFEKDIHRYFFQIFRKSVEKPKSKVVLWKG